MKCEHCGKVPQAVLELLDRVEGLKGALEFIANLPPAYGEPAVALGYYGQARRMAIDTINSPQRETERFTDLGRSSLTEQQK